MKNTAFTDAAADYYNYEKGFVHHLVPDGPNVVMDLGCAAGRLGKRLIELNKAAEVVGVEIFEPVAQEARKYYKEVHVGDIEEMNLNYAGHFDVVICGDVLEHLREPDKVIKQIHHWLKDGGTLICCLPNVRYWKVLRDLVFKGDFEYTSQGVLDQTHLRFYTTNSFRKLLRNSSFAVEKEEMRIIANGKQAALNKLTGGLLKDFLGIQMIFSARKTPAPVYQTAK